MSFEKWGKKSIEKYSRVSIEKKSTKQHNKVKFEKLG